MGRKRKYNIYDKLEITDISSEGFGVAKPNEKVVFVEKAIAGDIVKAQVFSKRKKFEKAKVLEFYELSKERTTPFCKHFDLCGGCKLQHISYEKQLEFKEKTVDAAFQRLAKVEIGEKLSILPAPETKYYRNKMEYTFSTSKWLTQKEVDSNEDFDKRALGLHIPGNFAKIVDLEECYLQADFSDKIRNSFRMFAKEEDISFYNILSKEGFLRNLVLRSTTDGELMILLIVGENKPNIIKKCTNFLERTFPEITSLHYIINEKVNDSYSDLESVCVSGTEHIEQKMGKFSFTIRPKSFFQTNPIQAVNLYNVVKDFANLSKEDVLYDLYSGVGSIGIYLSDNCKKVVGIEQIEQAVEDARENAKNNNIENTYFEIGDVRSILDKSFIKKHGRPTVLVTDPPRAGMHEDVVNTLLEAEVPTLIYVSCNPGTQARDVALLSEKYNVLKMRAVDMFPQTTHIENVALLKLK